MTGAHSFNLVIPMAGAGQRFKDAGYDTYKPFVPILDKPMVRYVTDAFPDTVRKFIIAAEGTLSASHVRFLKETLGCEVIDIAPHNEGPAFSILQAASRLPLDESFFISYCDIYWTWNFEAAAANLDCDGIIYTHTGFHPHLIGDSYSAFCLPHTEDPRRLKEIREKAPFTENWMEEPVSIGLFYVKRGHDMVAGIDRLVENDTRVAGEYFPSLLFNHLVGSGREVRLEPLKFFVHWGIPEQLRDFEHWHTVVNHDRSLHLVDGAVYPENVICMAGQGNRMKGVSELPKALIPVRHKPMYRFVADHFPHRHICAITLRPIAESMREDGFRGDLVILDEPTRSQFESLAMARDALRSRNDFFFTACDAYGLFDFQAFRRNAEESVADAAIFSFTPSLTQSKMVHHHTHVSVDGDRVRAVHVKSKSGNDDLGMAGFFWIRDGRVFDVIDQMPTASGEALSIDHVFRFFIESGFTVMRFQLDEYVHLGTAEELLEYQYWAERDFVFPLISGSTNGEQRASPKRP